MPKQPKFQDFPPGLGGVMMQPTSSGWEALCRKPTSDGYTDTYLFASSQTALTHLILAVVHKVAYPIKPPKAEACVEVGE